MIKGVFYIDGMKYTTSKREPVEGETVIITKLNGEPTTLTVREVSTVGYSVFEISPSINGVLTIYTNMPHEDEYYVVSDAVKTDEDIKPEVKTEHFDAVSHPTHYTQGGIEVIDIIAQTVAGYDDPFVAHCVATTTKYLNRAPYKHVDPLEDIKKGIKYLEFAIEHMEKNDNNE